ncbi:hypothetical protein [Frankia sp. Cr1]|uniref:hypothetical protein n=1 Tax=Frankia sp. Cr1 TaxID=3073931 RepID=UPI002AD3D4DB|nr:hypothetical protein [Frankia sp. Cr1]
MTESTAVQARSPRTLPARALALATLLAPVLLLAANAIEPAALDERHGTDPAKSAQALLDIAPDRARLPLFVLLLGLGLALLVPAAIGLTRLAGGRPLAVTGAALVALGAPMGALSNAVSALNLHRLTDPALPRGVAVQALAYDSMKTSIIYFLLYLLMFVGILLLGIALLRSGPLPRWQTALIGLGPLVVLLAPTGNIAGALAPLPFTLGMAFAAREQARPAQR